jgi:hypothetical protein
MTFARCEMVLVRATKLLKYELHYGQDSQTIELYDTYLLPAVDAHSDYIILSLQRVIMVVHITFSILSA